jgi:hypothetical protein
LAQKLFSSNKIKSVAGHGSKITMRYTAVEVTGRHCAFVKVLSTSNTYFRFDPANEIIGLVLAQTTNAMEYPLMQEFHTLFMQR